MMYEVRVAGFGGQGVITLGYVMGRAACIHDGKHTLMTQSYGPEARGGACRSDVIISDEPINYTKVSKVDCLIAMSIDAYNQFNQRVKPGGVIIHDIDLVQSESKKQDIKHIGIPSMHEAEKLGNRLTANMVMLGSFQSITEAVTLNSLLTAVRERFPRHHTINMKAVENGVRLGVELSD